MTEEHQTARGSEHTFSFPESEVGKKIKLISENETGKFSLTLKVEDPTSGMTEMLAIHMSGDYLGIFLEHGVATSVFDPDFESKTSVSVIGSHERGQHDRILAMGCVAIDQYVRVRFAPTHTKEDELSFRLSRWELLDD